VKWSEANREISPLTDWPAIQCTLCSGIFCR